MTSESGSYKIGERSFRDVVPELERLRIQAELAWPQELRTLERHGLRRDATVLEAGCGPGFVTSLLQDHVQDGSVTGMDFDPTMLAHARELMGAAENVSFVEGDAAATGLPAGSFDVVLARFLLQHVPSSEAVLEEFRRVLRPGGRLIAIDADIASSVIFVPEPPFYRELMVGVEEAQRRQGGDPRIGPRLPRLLAEAGFSEIAVDMVAAHSVVVGREAIRGVIPDQALDHLEASGAISPELAATAREYLARVDSGEVSYEGMTSYLVVSGSV